MAFAILVKCAKFLHLSQKVLVRPNSWLSTDSAVKNGKTVLNTKVNGWMGRRTEGGPSIISMGIFTKESSWTIEPMGMAFTIIKTGLSMWARGSMT